MPKKRSGRALSVPEKHQLKIARDTLRMSDIGARIMGGPSKAEAREIIRHLTTKNPASVIPRSWKQAKVRRLKDGRVQVMISGSSRNPLPKMARPSRKGSGWAPVATELDKNSASSLASYYRGLGWQSRAVKRGTKYDVRLAYPKRK